MLSVRIVVLQALTDITLGGRCANSNLYALYFIIRSIIRLEVKILDIFERRIVSGLSAFFSQVTVVVCEMLDAFEARLCGACLDQFV